MITLYGFLRPKPDRADDVRQILTALVEPTRQEDGNLEYHVHEQSDGRFFLYEVWRSEEDLELHNTYPPLREFLEHVSDYLVEPPEAYLDTMISPWPDRPSRQALPVR
ncbi:putative quinol monooxygenase [Cryptosporangium aurantiacum]|uniref:Quinol monooxygenase YgiN n=1 Tax=Cryptosporangium aurantiacum TaxID=134849 RepID=A0A1M7NQN3_9ACTN|nr:putative quinol monooxygenase [Cryptosporangium aurantiacum]SHN06104.1 Quinol monooxygenase YgiN [Cryptosporangium aurantiacum]